MKKVGIIFNLQSGKSNGLEEIKAFCRQLDTKQFDIVIREIDESTDVVGMAKEFSQNGFGIIVAAGGDGTLNTVAQALIDSEVQFGILPTGTLNHLAKDLKIPLVLNDALRLIFENHDIIKIDAGMCNGQVFLNNSGLGIYPRIVELRERFQKNGHVKWLSLMFAFFQVYKKIPKFYLRIKVGDEIISKKTAFVFVGNNIYGLGGLRTGTRDSLCDGRLSLWMSHRTSSIGLIVLLFHAIFGNLKEHRDFDVFEGEKVLVETKRKTNIVSFDGEIMLMESPLQYKIRPKCLKVIVPQQTSDQNK